MSTFTASNSVTVYSLGGNWDQSLFQFAGAGTPSRPDVREIKFEDVDLIALREFFRAEEDVRLGRWRWPENPDYVVYDNEDGGVWVHSEREPGAIRYQSASDLPSAWASNEAGYVGAARAFFDAHPEPKPWHDAKPGEVWALTWDGAEGVFLHAYGTWYGQGDVRVALDHPIRDNNVTAGRRIWPEHAS